jgi:hypothetical protein
MRDVSQSTKQGVVAKVIVDQSHGYNGIETGVTLIVLEGLAKKNSTRENMVQSNYEVQWSQMAIVDPNTNNARIFEEPSREIVATDVVGTLGDLFWPRLSPILLSAQNASSRCRGFYA